MAALPTWVIAALFGLVVAIVAAMFFITLFNLNAPRATLKRLMADAAKNADDLTVDKSQEKKQASSFTRVLLQAIVPTSGPAPQSGTSEATDRHRRSVSSWSKP